MSFLNILSDRIIRFSGKGAPPDVGTLPEVYAALIANQVESFPALRPHQRHAWHAFLVQLGALAMNEAAVEEPPEDVEAWRRLIRGLTPDFPDDEPWHLIVEDITKPAFLQPPASEPGLASEYRWRIETPDELDMLVNSKNHDLKVSVAEDGAPEDWIFALVTLQTMEGYSGRSNYGISRMPSGYGNRSAFTLTPSLRIGIHIKRDILTLLSMRQSLLNNFPMNPNGVGLMWTVLWDGTRAESMEPQTLDPFYIEVCRRIRLRIEGTKLRAKRATSQTRRMLDFKGLVGDPWMPVGRQANVRGTPRSFLGSRGLNYQRIVDGLVSPDWQRPPLFRSASIDGQGTLPLVARGTVRGEGGTEGYHERMVPIRERVVRAMGRAGGLDDLGDLARERLLTVRTVRRTLDRALLTFLARGDPSRVSDDVRPRIAHWTRKLDEIVDVSFIQALQDEFEEQDSISRIRIRNSWTMGIVAAARRLLIEATSSLPCPVVMRFRARAGARRVFEGTIHRSFPELVEGGESV